MCGIVGFTGDHQAAPYYYMVCPDWNIEDMIRQGLQSAMVKAIQQSLKAKGRLKVLADKTSDGEERAWNMWNRTYQMGNSWRNRLRRMPIRI